jgi:hypothetical protein
MGLTTACNHYVAASPLLPEHKLPTNFELEHKAK